MPDLSARFNDKSDLIARLLSVVILTFNEEVNLSDCLQSIRPLGSAVFIVDSGSVDRTREIAGEAGAAFIFHPFENQAQQLNWALDSLPITSPWVMRLDADERLMPELANELRAELPKLSEDTTGLFVKRRVYFMGKWIKHG